MNGSISRCLSYSKNKMCAQCIIGYKVDFSSGLCVDRIQFCSKYLSDFVCSQCQDEFEPNYKKS